LLLVKWEEDGGSYGYTWNGKMGKHLSFRRLVPLGRPFLKIIYGRISGRFGCWWMVLFESGQWQLWPPLCVFPCALFWPWSDRTRGFWAMSFQPMFSVQLLNGLKPSCFIFFPGFKHLKQVKTMLKPPFWTIKSITHGWKTPGSLAPRAGCT
jgi:hypothetical protein